LTQHSVNNGLKVFVEAGITLAIDELKQLHSREVLEMKMGNEHTTYEGNNAAVSRTKELISNKSPRVCRW